MFCHGIRRPGLRPRPSSTMAPTPLGNVIPGRLLRPLFVGSSPLSSTYKNVRLRRRLQSRLDGPSNATRYARQGRRWLNVSINKRFYRRNYGRYLVETVAFPAQSISCLKADALGIGWTTAWEESMRRGPLLGMWMRSEPCARRRSRSTPEGTWRAERAADRDSSHAVGRPTERTK